MNVTNKRQLEAFRGGSLENVDEEEFLGWADHSLLTIATAD